MHFQIDLKRGLPISLFILLILSESGYSLFFGLKPNNNNFRKNNQHFGDEFHSNQRVGAEQQTNDIRPYDVNQQYMRHDELNGKTGYYNFPQNIIPVQNQRSYTHVNNNNFNDNLSYPTGGFSVPTTEKPPHIRIKMYRSGTIAPGAAAPFGYYVRYPISKIVKPRQFEANINIHHNN